MKRGLILAPGRVLARNRAETPRRRRRSTSAGTRRAALAAHVVGYSTISRSRAGLEKSLNGDAHRHRGRALRPRRAAARRASQRADRRRHGRHDARPPRAAGRARAARPPLRRGGGARPAEREAARDGLLAELQPEPRRGELREDRRDHGGLPARGAARQPRLPGPLSAGLDLQGRDAVGRARVEPLRADSTFVDPGYCIAYGKRVNNFDTSRPFGNLSTSRPRCSTRSTRCSATSARRSARSGSSTRRRSSASTSARRSRRPTSERYPSGLYRNGELWYPERNPDVDAGRMAFGQERMLVTPLQMAMVAGGIGNAGIVMRPCVVEKLVSPQGQTRRPHAPRAARPRRRPGQRARHPGHDGARGPGRHRAPRRRSRATASAARRARPRRASPAGTRPGSSPSPAGRASGPRSRSRSCSRTSP